MDELSIMISRTPNHDNVLTEGIYTNKTFREASKDIYYVTNIRYRDFRQNSNLYIFKQYIEIYTDKDNDIICFGMLRGKRYIDVLNIKSYVKWVLETDAICYSPLYSFKMYINSKRENTKKTSFINVH